MLDPQERQLLFELLRPPDGYRLNRAVGTTYSLDLLALLVTPLAFTLFDFETKEGRITASPYALLESLRRYAGKIKVFCQAGQIHVPHRKRQLFGYLENSVIEVVPPNADGVFHPKLWVLRFCPIQPDVDSDCPIKYRLLCPSRNLTFDRSWDTMLVLEGDYPPRGRRRKESKVIGEFVGQLSDLAVRPVPAAARAEIKKMAAELERVAFEPPEGFDEVRLWPMGLDGDSEWPFDEDVDRLLVISPFLSPTVLQDLAAVGKNHVLVSRADSLQEIKPAILRRFKDVYTLDPVAESEPEGGDGADDPVSIDEQPKGGSEEQNGDTPRAPTLSGLHAKVYVADAGRYGHVWAGSANATHAAFNQNVEILVELVGRIEHCGIDAVLDPEGQGAGFWKMLQPYIPPEKPISPKSKAEIEVERRLDRFQRQVASSQLVLAVRPSEDDDVFRLELRSDDRKGLDIDELSYVGCRLITLKPHWERKLQLKDTLAAFDRVPFDSITSFVVFRAVAELDGVKEERQFVVNTLLEGEPSDRQHRLLLSMLKNSQQVMRYLLMLLADDGWDARRAIEDLVADDKSTNRPTDDSSTGTLGLPLLESMLRALAKDPGKLIRVSQLVTDLSKTPQGRALIPEGFDEVWLPIWQVYEEKVR